jgi:hypothetical protein
MPTAHSLPPTSRGTGAFNALKQYGTGAQCFPSIYAAPNKNFADTSTKTLPALAWQLDAALNNPADQGPFLERRMRERHAYFARKQFSTRGDKP